MGKPENAVYERFTHKYEEINKRLGLKQYLVPYLMSSHPGSTMKEAVKLAEYLRDLGYMPEQVQDFYPTPSTISTCMYYTGVDPRTMKPVYVPKNPHEKAMQRALIQYRNPKNYDLVMEALRIADRLDLVYKQVKNRLENQNPDIRMLVNAAGFGKTGTVEEIAKEDKKLQLRMIDLNCRGLTEMTCTCLPWMHKGTRIINLASAAAFCPQAKFAVYAATKSYVLSFSRSLAAELKEKGIFVTAVCPGPVDTPFFEVSGKLPGGMKEAVMADPVQVVKQALIDAKYKKEVSVYGTAMKGAEAATKVLPHGMILKSMSMMEKITKE